MARWRVSQIVKCDVHVWHEVEAESFVQALIKVNTNEHKDCPTCIDGADWEIFSDNEIVSTEVTQI
jgi:hypothetical protein